MGSSSVRERIWTPVQNLVRLQKLSPCKFGLVKNLSVLVPDPTVYISNTAGVGGAFAKILLT